VAPGSFFTFELSALAILERIKIVDIDRYLRRSMAKEYQGERRKQRDRAAEREVHVSVSTRLNRHRPRISAQVRRYGYGRCLAAKPANTE